MFILGDKMVDVLKIIVKVATLLTVLALLGLTGWSLTLGPHWGLFVTCLSLTAVFGYFSYRDIKGWLNK